MAEATSISTDDGIIAVGPAEAARRIGMSRVGVYNLMAEGKLPSVKVGRRRLIAVSSLRRLVGDDTGGDAA